MIDLNSTNIEEEVGSTASLVADSMVSEDEKEAEMSFGEGEDNQESEKEGESTETPSKKRAVDVSKEDLILECCKIMDEEYTAFSADDIAYTLLQRYKWNFKSV